ncbi:695_t:CDS:2 [Rhizophagus irregularis]|nr:695_t:CDS:2 [Rhizophagus irregularis]
MSFHYWDDIPKKFDRHITFKIHRHCSTTRLTNILHRDNDIKHSFDTSLVGYLDDTTWFGSSIEQTQQQIINC